MFNVWNLSFTIVLTFRHPLFPLLALLLEKCEQATSGDVDTRVVLSSLESDVNAFIKQERDGNKMLMTDNIEVDGLVTNGIINHVLLSKVSHYFIVTI